MRISDWSSDVCSSDLTTVERIAQDAECSRVAFYQYFSGKDEVFRHLAGEVARQLEASFEGMATVTADAEGWSSLRAWVERHASIHASYEPLYRSFDAAAGRSEEHTSDLQSLMRLSYAVFCLNKKTW